LSNAIRRASPLRCLLPDLNGIEWLKAQAAVAGSACSRAMYSRVSFNRCPVQFEGGMDRTELHDKPK
jgi:hypothetical protein